METVIEVRALNFWRLDLEGKFVNSKEFFFYLRKGMSYRTVGRAEALEFI